MQKLIMLDDLGFETGNRYVGIDRHHERIVLEGTFTLEELNIIQSMANQLFHVRKMWSEMVHEYKSS